MTIKLELPQDNILIIQAFGEALLKIAGVETNTVATETVGDVSRTVAISTAPPINFDDKVEFPVATEVPPVAMSVPNVMCDTANITDEQRSKLETLLKTNHSEPVMITTPPVTITQPVTTETPAPSGNIPWDDRIHSRGKSTVKDGSFKIKRKPDNMDKAQWEEYVKTVKLELAATPVPPVTTEVPVVMPVPPVVMPVPPVTMPTPPVTMPTPPVTMPTPPVTVEVPVEEYDGPVSFGDLMKFITGNNKTLPMASIATVLEGLGIVDAAGKGQVPLIAQNNDKIPAIYNELVKLL